MAHPVYSLENLVENRHVLSTNINCCFRFVKSISSFSKYSPHRMLHEYHPKCRHRSLHIPPLGRGPSLRVGGELSNLSRISSKPKMGNSEPGIHVILWPEASLGRSLSRYGCTILENPSPEIILVHSSPIPQWHAPYTVVCQ